MAQSTKGIMFSQVKNPRVTICTIRLCHSHTLQKWVLSLKNNKSEDTGKHSGLSICPKSSHARTSIQQHWKVGLGGRKWIAGTQVSGLQGHSPQKWFKIFLSWIHSPSWETGGVSGEIAIKKRGCHFILLFNTPTCPPDFHHELSITSPQQM